MINAKEAREYTIDYSKKIMKEQFDRNCMRIEKAIVKAIKHKETYVEVGGFQMYEMEQMIDWLKSLGYTVEDSFDIFYYPPCMLKIIW